jgi:hypothetical protein
MEWADNATVTKQGTAIQQFNLDCADINGNGRPELFVTAMHNGKVVSWVIEFKDGSYHRIADIPGFLRVLTYPGKGAVLLGQAYDPAAFYSGQPRQYLWSEGTYVPGAEVQLPKGLGVYGWTFANLGEGKPLLVALDDEDRLQVYSGETPVWRSAEQYTIVDSYVERPATGAAAVVSKQAESDKGNRLRLRGRVLAVDVNGDGSDEIIVPKNITGTFIGGFSGAELQGLAWTGARLDPLWSIKDIPGPVFDLRFTPDPAGVRINALVRTKGGLFTKDRQQVMIYSVR